MLYKVKSRQILSSLPSYSIAFYIIVSFLPFFTWNEWRESIKLFSLVFFFISFYLSARKPGAVKKNKIVFSAMLFALVFYMYLPFREYDYPSFGFLFFLPLLLLPFLPDEIVLKSFDHVVNFLLFVVIVSLLSQFLYAISAPYPEVILNQDVRSSSFNYYFNYYGAVVLNTQAFQLPYGIGMFRNSGWFVEPGHFGLFLCFSFAIIKDNLDSLRSWILALGVISTLSAAAYFIFVFLFLLKSTARSFSTYKFLLWVGVGVLSALAFYSLSSGGYFYDFVYSRMLSKFEGGGVFETLFSRAVFDFDNSSMSFFEILFGFGMSFLEQNGYVVSDFRSGYYKFGLFLYILLFFVIVGSLNSGNINKTGIYVFFAIVLLVLSHRFWVSLNVYFYFFLYVASISYGMSFVRCKDLCESKGW